MPTNFYTLLTTQGAADWINAQALGLVIPLTHIAVGDGADEAVIPTESATALVGEKFRVAINQIVVDPQNPQWLIIEAIIPANVGGWFIREIGLIGGLNENNLAATPLTPGQKLLAYGNFPETYKPLLAEGAAKDLVVRMIVQVSNASVVALKIDPAIVLATKQNVEQSIALHEGKTNPHPQYLTESQAVAILGEKNYLTPARVMTGDQIVLAGLPTIDGVQLAVGDRVLLTGQDNPVENGLWLAAASNWSRPDDYMGGAIATPGCFVAVDEGNSGADTMWMLATSPVITIGATPTRWIWSNNLSNTATESNAGITRLATLAETRAGVETNAVLVPAALIQVVPYKFPTGSPLPDHDIGPIWHDDYAAWMTWQQFTANGAAYTGYASQLVGILLLDTQPTPRAGYIASGATNLSISAYAALFNWARHNGLLVASGSWAAGNVKIKDNGNGTFALFDVRGEFLRAWDNGRGVDSGRAFGNVQGDAIRNITGGFDVSNSANATTNKQVGNATGAFAISDGGGTVSVNDGDIKNSSYTGHVDFTASRTGIPTAVENRPRNAALLAAIKF